MAAASELPASVEFGRFRVLPRRRELLDEGRPIRLGGRAFDVLVVLIEARGAVVGKDALIARVWPGRIVEDNSLQAQISALRSALGPDRELIRTVAGRGYQFTGEIRILPANPDERAGAGVAAAEPAAALPPTNLPEPVSELVGRDDELGEILNLTAAHRLVTLTGAGGIGKTRLALALARELLPHFSDGVWIAELAPLSDPGLVPAAVAAAVGLELAVGAVSPERVATALSGKRLLFVLDNCEHVIDAAARMAEGLVRANRAAHVIATSREPLKAEGEWVYPLPPLAVPAEDAEEEDDPQRYGAVRLFLERARAAEPHFAPDQRLTTTIAAVCRRLDGIPLAIELAAARAAALGIEELAARLDDRFRLLAGGRRTAMPRHQTLRATLDWSYELLTEPERVVLGRLAIFAGGFTLQAASVIAADEEIAASEVVDCVANLVSKSLVAVDVGGPEARYRLLETTLAYALEKLIESGETEQTRRRHAEFFRDLFVPISSEAGTQSAVARMSVYGREIDNVRGALDWAFSRAGDTAIGVALTAAYAPVWMHLSLNAECRERALHALECIGPDSKLAARLRTELYLTFGMVLSYTDGLVESTETALARALDLAESLDDVDLQLQTLWGMFTYRVNNGAQQEALSLAERFSRVARRTGDPADLLVGDRLTGGVLHYLGDQPGARRYLQRVVDFYVAPSDRRHTILFVYNQRVLAQARLARVLWLQGFVDQAKFTAQASLEDARAAGHQVVLCTVLSEVLCPIELMTGNLAAAERLVSTLMDVARRYRLPVWESWGSCLKGQLMICRGEFITGLAVLRSALAVLSRMGFTVRYVEFLNIMAQGFGAAGQLTESLATIDEALAQTDRDGQRWCVAESLRLKGELLLLQGAPGAGAAAEDHFRQALDWARRQGALSWELRAATSLARLRRDQGLSADATVLLQPVYGRFTEGFDTADLKAAKALLDALR
jgi:predicted ATPase/DNA-binding winged helix-turn-helix (wHTH) protein